MTDQPLKMKRHHRLGTSDITIGSIAYGCWRLAGTSVRAAHEKINTALEVGMNLIDTADIYGSTWPEGFGEAESLLGDVLSQNKGLRDQMVLATKGGIVPGLPYNSGRQYLMDACEASLKRLNCDVIDLYQIHRPDLLAHPAEVAEGLTALRASGKIREAGVSNYSPAQSRALQAHLDFPLVTVQPEFSAMEINPLTDGVLDHAMETGALVLAWSPLAGGDLLGDGKGLDATGLATLRALDHLANKYGADRSCVALAFLMGHPAGVVPIVGTQTPARIRNAASAVEIPLTRRDWYDILEARRGTPMP